MYVQNKHYGFLRKVWKQYEGERNFYIKTQPYEFKQSLLYLWMYTHEVYNVRRAFQLY